MNRAWLLLVVSGLASCTCLQPVDECVLRTCAQQGKDCGTISDGCGGSLECGRCVAPALCGGGGANVCGVQACQPATCASRGAQCGALADGCSATLDCGTCAAGQSCVANRCSTSCTPIACADLGAQCGVIPDGCANTLNCGSCAGAQSCISNRCATCTPRTCAQQSALCGRVTDGCGGMLECGTCPGSLTCDANRCVASCTPRTCTDQAFECGPADDGCGHPLNCGTCPATHACNSGRCVCTSSACMPTVVLSASRLAPTSTRLTWTFTATATVFDLERSTDGMSFTALPQPGGTARQADDSAQVRGTTYWYRVRAVTSAGPQAWSNVVRVDGVPVTPPVTNIWPTLGGDIGHTGFNSLEQGTPPLTLRWSALSTGVDPVVTDGVRVFATTAHTLSVFDAADGGTVWTHAFPTAHFMGQPAVFDGQVYVAHENHGSDTKLWAFNAQTGATTFSVAMSAQWEKYWAPVKVGNGVYTNGGSYGGLYGFDATTGANLFFNSSLAQYDEWSPASDGTYVYVFVAGHLEALNPSTGVRVWDAQVTWNWRGWSMLTSPVVANGTAYVIAPPTLFAIDLTTHAVRWSATGLNFSGTPAVANGVVYAVSAGNVRAHDAATGAYLWTFVGDGALSYPPVLTSRHLYASSTSAVFAADLTSHTQVWTAPGGGWLSLANGSLYVAGPSSPLRAYTLTPAP